MFLGYSSSCNSIRGQGNNIDCILPGMCVGCYLVFRDMRYDINRGSELGRKTDLEILMHLAQTKITILFLLHMILESDFSTRSNDLWRCGLTDCGLCESCELRLRVLQITNCNSRFLVIASSSRHSFSSRGGLILRVDWNPFTRLLHFHSTLGIDSSLIG